MDTPIDTGLPELPEGYFWRVSKSGGVVYVSIRKYVRANFIDRLLHVDRSSVVEQRIVSRWDRSAYSDSQTYLAKENARITDGVLRYSHGPQGNMNYDVSAEGIYSAAVAALTDWDAQKEKLQKIKSADRWLGDYPPKTLLP